MDAVGWGARPIAIRSRSNSSIAVPYRVFERSFNTVRVCDYASGWDIPKGHTPMRFTSMIHAVDVHACGEPGRVIVGGMPHVPGDTMFAKAQHLEQHLDHIRKRMLNEPRG